MVEISPNLQGFIGPLSEIALSLTEVVWTVSVDASISLAATVTVFGFRLQVGRYSAPTGELVRTQVRWMVPE